MRRIGLPRWLRLLGASPVAISLGLSLFLLSPSVSAQTAEQLEKQYGREAMQKALETKHLYDLYGIHFDVDQATIRPETQPLFDDIAQVLKNFPVWRLSIVGHTDATGDAAQNQVLSLQRANAVKLALVDRGIQASRLETEGAGPNQPVASNNTPEGRALNRRVALIRLDSINGQVIGAGAPIAGSTVTLWAAGAGAPTPLGQAQTGADGRFVLNATAAAGDEAILYLVAKGGQPAASKVSGDNPAIALLAVLGATPPAHVVINELTTVASVWTHNQFIEGTAIQGPALGIKIAAGHMPSFVDLQTGGWGTTIQDPLNSGLHPTMANLATLSSVLAGCVMQVSSDACSRLFTAATPPTGNAPTDTLSATEAIVRYPSYQPERVFALLDQFYPVPKGKPLRATPYMPYLTWAPSAWVFPLRYGGGGLGAPGKLMFDSEGNAWVGDNFIVGAQNTDDLWAGNLSKFAPDGRPLSPMTTGFTGGGLGGVGFGLAVDARDGAWATTYATRTIVHFDKNGKPLSPPDGFNFGGQLGLMQGIIVAPNGDAWAVGIEKSQLVHIPGGDATKGKVLCQNKTGNPEENPCRLAAPFHLAIDQQNRIWIGNAAADWVTRFPAADPSKTEVFKVGYSPSGMAVDSQGNLWVTNRFGNGEGGRRALGEMLQAAKEGKSIDPPMVHAMVNQISGGGSITVLRPDGSQAPFSPITAPGLPGPWAAAVDGNDNVWISNFFGTTAGIMQVCGVRPDTCAPGKKTGDPISPATGYVGGGLQMQVDVGIGPAGDVWVTNNWNDYTAALGRVAEPLSTLGGGQTVVVFHGMAKPVRSPLIGPARAP